MHPTCASFDRVDQYRNASAVVKRKANRKANRRCNHLTRRPANQQQLLIQ